VFDRGIVVKMNNEYVTVFKESTQEYDDIHINDTFFIKDILINKEWDKMEDDERFEALKKIHAPSPRLIMKSWNDLPKEIKELLTSYKFPETSHKEGKDDDMNNVDTRNFDDSANKGGFGGTERAGSTGEAGKDTGEKPVGGETKRLDAGQHKGGKKHIKERIGEEGADEHGQGKRDPAKEEEKDHTRVSDSIKLLSQQVSKDPEIAASDKKQEAGLQDTSAIDRQIVAHGKVQGRKEQGTKGKEIKEGVAALKAWQLWLAKREQEVLKEKDVDTGLEVRDYDAYQHRLDSRESKKDPKQVKQDKADSDAFEKIAEKFVPKGSSNHDSHALLEPFGTNFSAIFSKASLSALSCFTCFGSFLDSLLSSLCWYAS
jgi:hypothetical protein